MTKSTIVDEIELSKIKESGKDSCIICLNDIIAHDEIVKLPCTHLFHQDCIIKWFLEKKVSPMCKKEYNFGNNNSLNNNYYNSNFEDLRFYVRERIIRHFNLIDDEYP